MNLHQYLMRIKTHLSDNGQPVKINFDRFIKLLPKECCWYHVFAQEKVKLGYYIIEVVDSVVFERLIENSAPATDRINAAMQGDSHAKPTSYSFLLLYHQQLRDTRPEVVVIHNDELQQPFKPKKQLLIIENQENFFRYEQMLPILSKFYGAELDLSNCDIVFGAGNQINKGLNLCFFEQYHSVLCAFDFDYGGLSMFKTLKDRLNTQVTFLMPVDFAPYLNCFVKIPESADMLDKGLRLSDKLGFVHLSDAFKAAGNRFMEQESLLNELDSVHP